MAGDRAYVTWVDGSEGWTSGVHAAESAWQAKYHAYLSALDAGYNFLLTDFRAKTAPKFKALLPELRCRQSGYALEFAEERLRKRRLEKSRKDSPDDQNP